MKVENGVLNHSFVQIWKFSLPLFERELLGYWVIIPFDKWDTLSVFMYIFYSIVKIN